MKRILVLYRELAGYMVNCLEYLAKAEEVNIDIVAYPVAAEAPFDFSFSDKISVQKRSEVSDQILKERCSSGNYDLIFCGGWFDKGYLNAIKHKGKTPAVIGFDKQWKASMKDHLATLYLKYSVTKLFDFAFVPGSEQVVFATKMGFKSDAIKTGIYVCDTARFDRVFQRRLQNPELIKKRIIYAGRYIPEKDISNLMEVAIELAEEHKGEWEFHFIGTGAMWEQRMIHPSLIHHGFLDGQRLDELMMTGAAFVLPSLFEPWGVVVNEFAMAGYPLILSNQVGARTALLKENNGLIFPAGNKGQLRQTLHTIMNYSGSQRQKLGEQSHALASHINEVEFAKSMMQMLKKTV